MLKNPSDEYKQFLEAGDWVQIEAGRGRFGEDRVIEILFDVVGKLVEGMDNGQAVTPGWLNSEKIWKNHMAQRFKKMLG